MQQITGVIRLSIPVIVLYQLYPALFTTHWGIFICAFMVGIIGYLLNRRATNIMVQALRYGPSNEYREVFKKIISQCGMDPNKVSLVYAYTHERVAMTAYNTIILDPIVWPSIAHDPEATKVISVFEALTAPTLSVTQQQRITEIKQVFSTDAQAFIFKHELAHVRYQFSTKKLFVIGFVCMLAAYVSILTSLDVIYVSGFLAICNGIATGYTADLAFTWLSNLLFQLREEKAADLFAAHHSSRKEIEAAAIFFEQHQKIYDTLKDSNRYLTFLPSALVAGYPKNRTRAKYLRAVAAAKK
jgi:hypothetical protein